MKDRVNIYNVSQWPNGSVWRIQIGYDVVGRLDGYDSLKGARIAASKLGYTY